MSDNINTGIPIIFISHASEDKERAEWLKRILVEKYNGEATVFISEEIRGGKDWRTVIEENATNSRVAILLCSPIAVQKAWVIFEAGIFKGRGIETVPLLFAGATDSLIPDCIKNLQAKLASDEKRLSEAIETIQVAIKSYKQLPIKNISDYFAKIKSNENKVDARKSITNEEFEFQKIVDRGRLKRFIKISDYLLGRETLSREEIPNLEKAKELKLIRTTRLALKYELSDKGIDFLQWCIKNGHANQMSEKDKQEIYDSTMRRKKENDAIKDAELKKTRDGRPLPPSGIMGEPLGVRDH